MKKKVLGTVLLGALLAAAPMTAMATTAHVDLGNPVMYVNANSHVMRCTAGVNDHGRILVPVRELAEAFGGTVSFDSAARQVSMTFANGNWATITVQEAVQDGQGDEMTYGQDGSIVSVGTFVEDRLYLPAELMAVCLGGKVECIDYNSDHVYRLIYHVR